MFTLQQVTQIATRFRLADGQEGFATKALEKPADFYAAGASIRLERDWLAGKLSDEEAATCGLKPEWQQQFRDNPAFCDSTDPFFQYWATFEPGDLLLATTSIHLPVVRLQDIVAIKLNGGEWIEDPKRGEP